MYIKQLNFSQGISCKIYIILDKYDDIVKLLHFHFLAVSQFSSIYDGTRKKFCQVNLNYNLQ